MRHQKKTVKLGTHRRAPEGVAGESGLQFDRTSADQNHTRQSQSGPAAGGKNGDVRQERLAPRAPDGSRGLAPEGRCQEIVRRHRAAQREPQWRLHPHHQTRPAQERFRGGSVSRMGGCGRSDRGDSSGRGKGKKGKSAKGEAAAEADAKAEPKAKKTAPNEKSKDGKK